jgi:HEAT repeat protein
MNRRSCLIAACWACVCMASAAAQDPQFLGRTRQGWVDQLESGFRRQRSHAAWGLQEFAAEQLNSQNAAIWLNELLLLTESSSPSVRYWGAVGLGRMIGKLERSAPARSKALDSLPQLLKDLSPAVRIAAADALEQASDKSAALAVLVESMAHPQDAVRIQAVTALERWGEAARPAAQTLRSAAGDSSEYVKRIAARTLAKLDGKSP